MTKCADYLWVLGGKLIRHVNIDEKARKLPTHTLIIKRIYEARGPCGVTRVVNKSMLSTTPCAAGSIGS